jgi:flagellum-specific peptidoglycan hydrolase FlgJ
VSVSFDTSFALRADPTAPARDGSPTPSRGEEQFASALAHAQASAGVDRPEAAQGTVSGARLVAPTRTRLSGDEAASALEAAWTEVRGQAPSTPTLSILVAQWAHETGRGASMLNYNFGGLKGTGPSGLSAACSTREGHGANAVRVVDRFRAYGSAEEGARDYVSLLARRYPDALRAAESGDAKGFVTALKARGYFTDDEAAYCRSVQSLASLVLRSGFSALGTASSEAVGASPALPAPPVFADGQGSAELASTSLLDAGDLLERLSGAFDVARTGSPVAPGAFADEVQRAALLMSALRIGEPRSRET